jgi:hypothetical protein
LAILCPNLSYSTSNSKGSSKDIEILLRDWAMEKAKSFDNLNPLANLFKANKGVLNGDVLNHHSAKNVLSDYVTY